MFLQFANNFSGTLFIPEEVNVTIVKSLKLLFVGVAISIKFRNSSSIIFFIPVVPHCYTFVNFSIPSLAL